MYYNYKKALTLKSSAFESIEPSMTFQDESMSIRELLGRHDVTGYSHYYDSDTVDDLQPEDLLEANSREMDLATFDSFNQRLNLEPPISEVPADAEVEVKEETKNEEPTATK